MTESTVFFAVLLALYLSGGAHPPNSQAPPRRALDRPQFHYTRPETRTVKGPIPPAGPVASQFKQTIDWALANLQATDTAAWINSQLSGTESFTGMVFDSASLHPTIAGCDPNAVWLEGMSHSIAALVARATAGGGNIHQRLHDLQQALAFVATCETAQEELGGGRP